MKPVFKNEWLVVALLAAALVAVSALAVVASRQAPAVTVHQGSNPTLPKPAVPVPAPTDRTP